MTRIYPNKKIKIKNDNVYVDSHVHGYWTVSAYIIIAKMEEECYGPLAAWLEI